MNVRKYNPKRDMPKIISWWKERTNVDVHEALLSGRGFVVSEEGVALAMGFVYCLPKHRRIAHLVDTYPMAFSGFEISNPNAELAVQARAMATLIQAREDYARGCGAKFMLSVSDNPGYNKFLEEIGYSPGGKAVKLVRGL